MELLGARLRWRRRQLKLRQGDIVGTHSGSFLSKVENGVAQPSLSSLRDWSEKLETTAGELLGDHLVLEAAKQCILLTEKCHLYLDHLDPSPTTRFLKELSSSATALSVPVPDPPCDPELQHLTAKVLLHRGMVQEAKEIAERTLPLTFAPLLRIHHLFLLCQIYRELAETSGEEEVKDAVRAALLELDHYELLHKLPDAEALSANDLNLLTVSAFIQSRHCL